jgi:hypothetical protein
LWLRKSATSQVGGCTSSKQQLTRWHSTHQLGDGLLGIIFAWWWPCVAIICMLCALSPPITLFVTIYLSGDGVLGITGWKLLFYFPAGCPAFTI